MNNGILPPLGNIESAKQNLVKDMAAVAADSGAILNEVVRSSADEMARAKTRLEASLNQAKSAVSEQAVHAAEVTASYVRHNPWKTLGIAAAAGVIIGALLKR